MADIFISYSSKDKEKADQLSELLVSAGLSVWIDRQGIEVSTSWSKEIVQAIDGCKAFVVLLSPNSILSKNVIKELSLAAERNKKILPLDLEPVSLPDDLAYHLAGIQRAPMTNIDAIIRALRKLGLQAIKAPEIKLVKESDARKSLMILPFDDLSPTADNQWFADGIVTELIGALSNVKALRITDPQTTKEFKSYKGHLAVYAKEMSIRYFVQGSVRKMGDQLKIMAHVLDIETGDYLWQDSLKGTLEDIFDIQETVARKVTDGLNIILTAEEEKRVAKKPTDNVVAYELRLKGNEYFARSTKGDYECALSLYEEAALIDPNFAAAQASIANTSQELYRVYDRNPDLLIRSERAAERVKELEGVSAVYFWLLSKLSLRRSDAETALQYAKRSIELDPAFANGYDALSFVYQALGMKSEAAKAFKDRVRLQDNDRNAHFNLNLSLYELGNESELAETAERALAIFERHVRLNPDDYHARVNLAHILGWCGRAEDSLAEAEKLSAIESLDGQALYNLACIYLNRNMPERGMELLRRTVKKGFRDIETFRRDPDLAPLRGTEEFEEMMKGLEKEKNV